MRELTEKQKRFADFYLIHANATKAAKLAGYSERTADVIGSENLRKPHIREYIKERNDQFEAERVATIQEVKELWTEFMRENNLDVNQRLKASEFLAKTFGMFIDKHELKHEGGLQLSVDWAGEEDEENED